MGNATRKQRITIVVILIFLVGLVSLGIYAASHANKENQFGKYIPISNYASKVKNVSSDVKDAIQSSLYNTVVKNKINGQDASKVRDAKIRDGSDSQTYDKETQVYSGNFIVDMAKIKQSYKVQYSYSTTNTIDTGGSPVTITCLETKDLIYGDFGCTDLASQQSSPEDQLLQYLPYQGFTFGITPDRSNDGKLIIAVTLTIPDSEMPSDAAGKAQAIAYYKSQATDWIKSKGLDPSNYTLSYNYDDAGNEVDTSSGD